MNWSDLKAVLHKEFLERIRNYPALLISLTLCACYAASLYVVGVAVKSSAIEKKELHVAVAGDILLVARALTAEHIHVEQIRDQRKAEEALLQHELDALLIVPAEIRNGSGIDSTITSDGIGTNGSSGTGGGVRTSDSTATDSTIATNGSTVTSSSAAASNGDAKSTGSRNNQFQKLPTIKIKTAGGQSGLLATVRITSILEKLRQHLQENRLSALNLKLPFFTSIQSTNVESSTVHAGKFIALTLPLILTMIIVATCVSFSVDSIDGERSRKTWQLLLVSPLDRNSLLYGKLAATVLSVFLGIATCFTSLLICSALADASHMDLGITFGIPEALTAAMISIPLVISLSALFFLLCMCARNTQEASIFTTAATIVCTLLPFVSTIPAKFVAPALFLIPVVNVALCVSESLETGLVAGHFATTIFTSCLIGAACIYGCTNVLKNESLLFNIRTPSEFRTNYGGLVIGLCAVVFILFLYIGQILMSWDTFYGTIITQICVIALPAWLTISRTRLPLLSTMRWQKPNWYLIAGGALLAPGLAVITLSAASAQNFVLPMPTEFDKMMKQIVLSGRPLWQTFIAMAITPGICEEMLFRGAILGMLSKTMKPLNACLITAILFGLFHTSVFRFLPTFIAGFALSLVAVATGSIFPCMILHATYNCCAILAALNEEHLQWWYIIPALISTLIGVALLGGLKPGKQPSKPQTQDN